MLEDNTYLSNYGIGSGIMSVSSPQTPNRDLALDVAIIQLQNEIVANNVALATSEDPYPKIYKIDGGFENMQTSIIVRESTFTTNRYILFQVQYAAFYMDGCHISNQPDANFEGLLTLEESVERMSLEIYDMLQDEAQNRISTSPVSTQTYNVFVLKKSLNVWILGDAARAGAAI